MKSDLDSNYVQIRFEQILTMIGGEIAVLLSDIFEVARCRVDDLDVACDVFVTPESTEIVETILC